MALRRFGLTMMIALSGSACGGSATVNNEVIVSGIVTDAETDAPLARAQVQTMPETTQVFTDAQGRFALPMRLGVRVQVQAALDGFEAQTQTFTPVAGQDNALSFALDLVQICVPGQRRCVLGNEEGGVEVCADRGNLWQPEPCAGNQTCDPADVTCRETTRLFVILDTPGGVIRSQPVPGQDAANINCGTQCTADYFKGTMVTLVATPLAQSAFTGWRGTACAGMDPVCVVDLNEEQRVGGGFIATAFGLTVRTVGQGDGRVTSQPEGINCGAMCNAAFERDAMVTLVAEAEPGSVFARWEQDCSVAGAAATCTLTMEQGKRARARFVPEGVAVTVTKDGNGQGRVTSDPSGIDCGANCMTTYEEGQQVTLTASAAAGSTFVGWGGDCSGSNLDCVVVADMPRNVNATFEAPIVPPYLSPLAEDGDCAFLMHMDGAAPEAVLCGGAASAVINGQYTSTPSRVAALSEGLSAQGPAEAGFIDVGRALPAPDRATLELTLRKDGPAFGARGRAVLISDEDSGDPETQGLRLSVMDDGRVIVSTRDASGTTSTATSAVSTLVNGTWYHLAVTVEPMRGLAIFVDGIEVVRAPGAVAWTASSSTAWVGAERDSTDSIYRFNGAMDEVRVSNVVRY